MKSESQRALKVFYAVRVGRKLRQTRGIISLSASAVEPGRWLEFMLRS